MKAHWREDGGRRKGVVLSDCVIVGGSGFIGTHLTEYFLQHKSHEQIHVLDLVKPRVDDARVLYYFCDVRRPIRVDIGKCSVIYNLAALCKEPGYEYEEYFHVNHTGAVNVCDFADRHGIPSIVYTSTIMVFRAGEQAMTESSPTCPDNAYGISKLLGEKAHEAWQARGRDRHLKIVRAAVVFGRHERGNYTRLYRQLRRNLFFYVGRKDTVKASVYVADVVRFLDWCARDRSTDAVFNLALPECLTIERICGAVCDIMSLRRPFLVVPFRLARGAARAFEYLDSRGLLKSGIHHRHIEKLYLSTNIVPANCVKAGFRFAFSLEAGLEAWKRECGENELY